jgi:hypothetical protein
MKKLFVAALVGTTMLASPVAVIAGTANADQVVAASKANPNTEKLMKLSEEGFVALRAVRGARIAIFNGDPAAAKTMVNDAVKLVGQAEKSAKDYVGRSNQSGASGANPEEWIPVDGSITLGEDFTMTDKKKVGIAKAHELLTKGKTSEAVAKLKETDIDVSYARVMLPLNVAAQRLEKAQSLLNDGKYYEANLALKGVEESAVVDTVALIDVPK